MSVLKLPYVHYFETSFGREYERTFILLEVFSQGVVGYGEVVAGQSPLYSYETTKTAWHVLKDFLIPLLLEKRIQEPDAFHKEAQQYRGHSMAKAGLELALWDLKAKLDEKPLSILYGGMRTEIPAGVSVGIQDSIDQLLDRINVFIDQGYQRVKVKIKPGWDVQVCQRIRQNFPDILLQADANGAYRIEDSPKLRELDDLGLLMLEQPFPPYDLLDHSLLQKEMSTPLCLDESILSSVSARQAFEMGSCRIINIKIGRVGGIVESRKIHDFCQEHSIPVWCGGMLESGIGRAHNVHLASLPDFKFPNDISASSRYFEEDIVEPAFEITREGTIVVPSNPGIGVEPIPSRIESATLRQEVFTP
jgi:O-succinylbenzoate synthase